MAQAEPTLFKDHFSQIAARYADFRPRYPQALFTWLVSISAQRELVWDCACGSGQATEDLARHFMHVIATDASAAQLARAPSQPNVEYRVALAEQSGLESASVDLIVVAQALHWLDHARFYAEAQRVLRPGGLLAVWTYGASRVGQAAIDAIVRHFYDEVVGPYWPPERRHIDTGYRDLPFPFAELTPPPLRMQVSWSRSQLMGYLRSWSATARFVRQRGFDPVDPLDAQLAPLWPDASPTLAISWPLALRVGRSAMPPSAG
jgi:SAM-dependent methyltransferase